MPGIFKRIFRQVRQRNLPLFGANRITQRSSNRPQIFSYGSPARDEIGKQKVQLTKSENLRTSVQILGPDYRENLHSHDNIDGFWLVLSGSVAFYGPDDTILGEFGALEGIFIPRKMQYRYMSTSEKPAEILQVLSFQARQGMGP